ncbi:hypothetical protein JOF56_003726 [Kibdelosporangium banguiense]|uniref:Dephospho-CoA kinase n=1 Tax=Kibdelosporangium banguiense TaxID=1365924 RepID=A0ABS4TFY9_9PSEU|nr:hypothetical protein [Kibdelosporangium banguiense]MBP2323341.1 hypothetical protein [Kibdelosporangium banguiense]
MASLVVGITGKKRSGKDTFAHRLIEHHGFTRIAFADALRAVMEGVNPVVPIEADETGIVFGPDSFGRRGYHRLVSLVAEVGWERAKEAREVRRLLQTHGVSIREQVNPDVWVDAVRLKANAIPGPVVITDVRFPNEAEYVQKTVGGQLLKIVRSGHDHNDTHISETALDAWPVDHYIANDGDMNDLHVRADVLVRMFLTTC